MRSLTRVFLATALVALFALGFVSSVPAYANCGEWPTHCKGAETNESPELFVLGAVEANIRILFQLAW
jgi:hypothetical protein